MLAGGKLPLLPPPPVFLTSKLINVKYIARSTDGKLWNKLIEVPTSFFFQSSEILKIPTVHFQTLVQPQKNHTASMNDFSFQLLA